jgi:hypothetical protein
MRTENRTQDQSENANDSYHYTTSILINMCCKQYTYQIEIRSTRCQHRNGLVTLETKNTVIVDISSFNLELNFVTNISSSYIIQIRCFLLDFF